MQWRNRARNVSCTGATPVAATNCLNFGNPEKPQIMWQFSQVVDGLTEACTALETPITGGNVSLYNETLGEGIYPTPVIGIVGTLENVEDAMTFHFRQPERDVFLLSGAAEHGECGSGVWIVRVCERSHGADLGRAAGARSQAGSRAAEVPARADQGAMRLSRRMIALKAAWRWRWQRPVL